MPRSVQVTTVGDPRLADYTRLTDVRLRTHLEAEPGQHGSDAILEVADTGVGIPAGELPRIFDRFWRGQAGAQTSGSGIGLTIAAELTRAHGGTLTADSQPGQGTRFTLTLPRA